MQRETFLWATEASWALGPCLLRFVKRVALHCSSARGANPSAPGPQNTLLSAGAAAAVGSPLSVWAVATSKEDVASVVLVPGRVSRDPRPATSPL